MLYQAIRLACKKYHKVAQFAYDVAYNEYIRERDVNRWQNSDYLDTDEVNRIITFVNQWKCMMPRNQRNIEKVLVGLKRTLPELNRLKSYTLLNVNFDETTSGGLSIAQLIEKSFDIIADAGQRFESVATSKMLNVAINSDLFVMWDNNIQHGYRVDNKGYSYAHEFLPRMQQLAQEAIAQIVENEDRSRSDAIKSLTPCSQSLAKVLDEYNYMKFTSMDLEVWQTETQ